jgi:hypothetical protein
MISSVYNNKNSIPVNKQAVKEFFKDHEALGDQPSVVVKMPDFISIEYFKKARPEMGLAVSISDDIDAVHYERVAGALKKMKAKPNKIKSLARLIQNHCGSPTCKKKYALLIVNAMIKQLFIKVKGDDVVYL